MLSIYSRLKSEGTLPDELWDEWLWRTDPEERYSPDVLMNRCHLLGLMMCLYKGLTEHEAQGPGDARLAIMDKPVSGMSLRELKDTVENLQVEWPSFLQRLPANPNAQDNLDAVIGTIEQCVSRFGILCGQAANEEVMDDLASVEPSKAHPGLFQVTPACIRRMVCTFLVLYRHLHLLAVATPVSPDWCDCGVTKYHMEASGDDFNLLCMHLSLPVAGRLNYKNDFPEMYNHVSQAVFFHNPDYQRAPRVSLEDLPKAPAEQVLPALWQLHPEIDVLYEEDRIDLAGPGRGRWAWLVLAGRIYLLGPENQVWYSPSVASLLGNVYLVNPANPSPGGQSLPGTASQSVPGTRTSGRD